MSNSTDRNPEFYEIASVSQTTQAVIIRHRYDTTFRCELTLTELARAANKFGADAGDTADTHYLRLWREAKNILIKRGYVPEIGYRRVELRETEGRRARRLASQ